MKVLLLLTLILAFATFATTAVSFNLSTPNSFGITNSVVKTVISGDIQPMGDPVDNPVLPC